MAHVPIVFPVREEPAPVVGYIMDAVVAMDLDVGGHIAGFLPLRSRAHLAARRLGWGAILGISRALNTSAFQLQLSRV